MFLLTCMLACFGCQNDEAGLALPKQLSKHPKVVTMNKLGVTFATSLAASMKDPAVRTFLKEEATVQFEGDYDILFAQAKSRTINSSANGRLEAKTFGEIVTGSGFSDGQRTSALTFTDSLESEYPTLQISIPMLDDLSAEDWDAENSEILAAVIDDDQDDQLVETIIAFDSDGNIHYLDANCILLKWE